MTLLMCKIGLNDNNNIVFFPLKLGLVWALESGQKAQKWVWDS